MTATKEKTGTEKAYEVLPPLLRNEPLNRLIDEGISAPHPEGLNINSLALDEEYEEKYAEYVALQNSLKKILSGLQLPEAGQTELKNYWRKWTRLATCWPTIRREGCSTSWPDSI
jgi:hypothetical protein